MTLANVHDVSLVPAVFLDDICDYFGVKIALYFAWLGFYTTSMLYPAVIGFVLWLLTESDQVSLDTWT